MTSKVTSINNGNNKNHKCLDSSATQQEEESTIDWYHRDMVKLGHTWLRWC